MFTLFSWIKRVCNLASMTRFTFLLNAERLECRFAHMAKAWWRERLACSIEAHVGLAGSFEGTSTSDFRHINIYSKTHPIFYIFLWIFVLILESSFYVGTDSDCPRLATDVEVHRQPTRRITTAWQGMTS